MVTRKLESPNERVRALLSASVPAQLSNELLDNHHALKRAFLCGDWEKCLLRGGKLAETVMKIVHFRRTNKTLSSIGVEHEIQEAEKSSLPDELRLLIPRHVRPLYDHRSRRGGGHGSFDPNPLDATVVVVLADWLVGELIRLFGQADPREALRLVSNLTARLVPLVEEIDGDLLVHKKGASCRQELELILYQRHPQRTEKSQLYQWTKNHTHHNIDVTVDRMQKDKEIHANGEGIVLTTPGLRKAEALLSQVLQ